MDIAFHSISPLIWDVITQYYFESYILYIFLRYKNNIFTMIALLATLLTIKHKWLMESSCRLSHLSVCLSMSVNLSGKCTVTKWLIGSGCHLGW